jgi:hypothetical protein
LYDRERGEVEIAAASVRRPIEEFRAGFGGQASKRRHYKNPDGGAAAMALRSARRPLQVSAADEVHVEVEDGLARTRADVQYSAIAILDGALASDVSGGQMATADEFGVFGLCVFQTGEMFLGNDENVSWPLRVEIFECEGVFVFVNFLRRHFAADNAAKQTVRHKVRFRFRGGVSW